MNTYQLNLESVIDLTDDQFYQLCRNNPDLKFERNAKGDLIIMSPTGGETGNRNFNLALELGKWNEQTQLGVCFDSSTGFKLPNGVRLGWLINRNQQQVEIYRQGQAPERLNQPVSLSGESILPGFTLNLDLVW